MTLQTLPSAERKRQSALSAIPPIERSETDGELRITHGATPAQASRYLEALGGE